jgi:hypothetical protein
MFHPNRTSPGGTEKADERADGDDDALSTLDSMRARSIKDKGPQSFWGISSGVITDSIEKSQKDVLIDIERRLSQSTVCAHPGTESPQDGPSLSSGWLAYKRRKLAPQPEKPDE